MLTVELDYGNDEDDFYALDDEEVARPLLEASVTRWLAEFGFADVTYVIKKVFGPAGGAAVIDFTASSTDRLREFVTFYDNGNGDVEYLLGNE